jgi:hypothetical protein
LAHYIVWLLRGTSTCCVCKKSGFSRGKLFTWTANVQPLGAYWARKLKYE